MKATIRIVSGCAAALCLLVLGAVLDGVAQVDQHATATPHGRTRHTSAALPARRPHPSTLVAANRESR